MMDDQTFSELLEDIREHGQREPIVYWQNQLLDGRNRLKACKILNIEPDEVELNDDTDPVAWVISANLHRRHLTESQRAMVGARARGIYEEEAKERQKQSPGRGKPKDEKGPVNCPDF